jgi:hypothetical protein
MKRVDRWEMVIAIGRHSTVKGLHSYAAATLLNRLARCALKMHALYEWQCSEPIEVCDACGSVAGRKHIPSQCFYARLERLERQAEAIGAMLGVVVTSQRDPRGPAVSVWADQQDGKLLGVFS